jgi:hypothetical protein
MLRDGNRFLYSFVLGLLLFAARSSDAQVYNASIAGRVVDQSGAALPGVTVTIESPQLLQPQTAITTETGAFRFAELPVGTYNIRFELQGFRPVVREGVQLTAGMTATINPELQLGAISETVTVTGESPIVDVREFGTTYSFDDDRLEGLPTARDPWVILETTPGIVVDRQNIGGNESGQQSNWFSRGTDFSQNSWYYDGVNITDMAAVGASPMYYDFSAFEEINISTGGEETRQQTAGTQISFVIKQGTNDLAGRGWAYGTGSSLQGENVDDELRAQGAGAGAPIKEIYDYGIELGGPLIRDRLWAWGDYGVQDITVGTLGFLVPGCLDAEDPDCLEDDPTKLRNNNLKINYKVAENNSFNFLWARNDKTKDTRGAAINRPLDTTWRQSGPTNIFKFEDNHTVNSNLLFVGRFAYVSGGFVLDYQRPELRNVQASLDLDTGNYDRSFLGYETDRPQYTGNVDGNYFVSNVLGGDHEFKFGFQYKKALVDSFTTYGGDVWAIFASGQPAEAWFFRPAAVEYEGTYGAGYVEDIFTRGRATMKLGLRYDYQTGRNTPSQIPANLAIPQQMPAIQFPGTETIDAWQSLSPRLGVTFDISGDGRLLGTASYARYSDLLLLSEQIAFNNAAGVSEMDLPWNDLNGDRLVQGDEVDFSTVLFTDNFDPANPASLSSPDVRDPETSPPKTDEFIIGIKSELRPNLGIEANYIYRKFHNMIWEEWPYSDPTGDPGLAGLDFPLVGIPASAWVPVTQNVDGRDLTWYELAEGFEASGELFTNRPDYHQRYHGLEIAVSRRFQNNWSLNGGFTISDTSEFFDGLGGVFDPTNTLIRDEGQVSPFTTGSGKSRVFLNSRWVFRLDGVYNLPWWNVVMSGRLNGRQGFPFLQTFRTPVRAGGIGRTEVLLAPVGESRYDNLWIADLRFEKGFQIGESTEISGIVDIFNVTNANTILRQESRQNLDTANRIEEILSARILRFGVRVTF